MKKEVLWRLDEIIALIIMVMIIVAIILDGLTQIGAKGN